MHRYNAAMATAFADKKVVDLPTIQNALGKVSVPTAFRYLKLVPYRCSYNHNGRYYALYGASRFDRSGLWSFQGIHFSVDGTLRNTVRRLVREAPAGATHSELQLQLQLRVHNTLLELWSNDEIGRESLAGFYVYLHPEDQVRRGQRFGIICFGSRLDIYLPGDSDITVKVGEKVQAGTSILGQMT